MQREARKYLHDIRQAAAAPAEFTAGRTFEDYARAAMLRAPVGRRFEIIGEALAQLAKRDASLAASIGDHRRIIVFPNILIHGYANVDDKLVWGVVETKLPVLRREVDVLLNEP